MPLEDQQQAERALADAAVRAEALSYAISMVAAGFDQLTAPRRLPSNA
jgi:hypothetical protein